MIHVVHLIRHSLLRISQILLWIFHIHFRRKVWIWLWINISFVFIIMIVKISWMIKFRSVKSLWKCISLVFLLLLVLIMLVLFPANFFLIYSFIKFVMNFIHLDLRWLEVRINQELLSILWIILIHLILITNRHYWTLLFNLMRFYNCNFWINYRIKSFVIYILLVISYSVCKLLLFLVIYFYVLPFWIKFSLCSAVIAIMVGLLSQILKSESTFSSIWRFFFLTFNNSLIK